MSLLKHYGRAIATLLFSTTLIIMFISDNLVIIPRRFNASEGGNLGSLQARLFVEKRLLWLFRPDRILKLWPEQDEGDRIEDQLAFVPPNLEEMTEGGTKLKTIFLNNVYRLWIVSTHPERRTFLEDKCPVDTCRITTNASEFLNADAVIFTQGSQIPNETRPNEEQIWVLYVLESPYHSTHFYPKVFNWTVSYRPDSDVPNPYGKFFLTDPSIITKPQTINYATNKTKLVAWSVSNCHAANKRWEYAVELAKYIEVHIYGPCLPNNPHSCPRSEQDECMNMLKQDYKFYLSFENSNCKHYITEKLFNNALMNNVIPIVMGARKEDYERVAPYHSFIHVDDFHSPKALAQYLHKLDENDSLYNEYFQWKGTGEFSRPLDAQFWCRFCAMLHADIPKKTYDDMDVWWRPEGTCTRETWKINATLL